jgi:ABC-type transport system involved in cytochrome bd biosynthesis fused ATPase/permease subunit
MPYANSFNPFRVWNANGRYILSRLPGERINTNFLGIILLKGNVIFGHMNNSIKYYLAAYNAVAFIFWLAYLVVFISNGLEMNATGLLLLNIAQGMAVLEILHAITKWVRSPVGSTAAQVFSRILVLVLINVFISQGPLTSLAHLGITVVSIAWGITELVRYSFYFLSLFDKQPMALLWMRYTFFIVLYPTGVTGEWLIIASPLVAHFAFNLYAAMAAVLAVSYIYYFPVLYMYMWKQRKARIS